MLAISSTFLKKGVRALSLKRSVSTLISTQELNDIMGTENVRIMDATWFMPVANRSGFKEYKKAHIKDAIFFDIDGVADKSNPLPHMLPSPQEFEAHMESLGISTDDHVIVYDNNSLLLPRLEKLRM